MKLMARITPHRGHRRRLHPQGVAQERPVALPPTSEPAATGSDAPPQHACAGHTHASFTDRGFDMEAAAFT